MFKRKRLKRLRANFLWWATLRMVEALYHDNERRYGHTAGAPGFQANPEEWQDVAYVMLCGLFGVKPKA